MYLSSAILQDNSYVFIETPRNPKPTRRQVNPKSHVQTYTRDGHKAKWIAGKLIKRTNHDSFEAYPETYFDTAENFDDIPLHEPRPDVGKTAVCAQCKGHGKWNYQLNAYGPGEHFQIHCSNCNGWGYVQEKYAGHVHNWYFVKQLGRCLRLEACDCGAQWEIDSSD